MRYETQLFQEQLAEIRKGSRREAEQIDAVLQRIAEHPEANDGPLKGPRAGQFKKKAVDRKYRILFKWCRHCVRTNKQKCSDCIAAEDDAVILQEVFLRKDGYD